VSRVPRRADGRALYPGADDSWPRDVELLGRLGSKKTGCNMNREGRPMRKQAVSGRGGLPKSIPCFRRLLACTVAVLGLGTGAISAHADGGVSGEFADMKGIFATSCQDLRKFAGLPLGGVGDVVVACDPDGEQCHLVSSTGIDEGSARGYCGGTVNGGQPNRKAKRSELGGRLED